MTEQDKQEINALCAKNVKGWVKSTSFDSCDGTQTEWYCDGLLPVMPCEAWNHQEDLTRAFELLKELKAKGKISAYYICDNYVKLFVLFSGMRAINGDCQTTTIKKGDTALAISLACLKAKGINVSKYEESEL